MYIIRAAQKFRRILYAHKVFTQYFEIPWVRKLYAIITFNFAYSLYPSWDSGKPPVELVELVEEKVVKPCRSIDLGCGRGHIGRYLQSKGFDTCGIDISVLAIRQAIKISRAKGFQGNFIKADVLSYIPEQKFSLITDKGFYHVLPENERKNLAEYILARYLRRGGSLLLWCRSKRGANRVKFRGISEAELLSFFSDNWNILKIRRTRLGPNRVDAFFMHAKLKR